MGKKQKSLRRHNDVYNGRERFIVTIKLRSNHQQSVGVTKIPGTPSRHTNIKRPRPSIKLTFGSGLSNSGTSRPQISTYSDSIKDFQGLQGSQESDETDDTDDLIPYRGVISGEDASTKHTLPQEIDIKKFENAVRRALEKSQKTDHNNESKWAAARKSNPSSPLLQQTLPTTLYSHGGGSAQALLSQIKRIRMGDHEIDTWYTAPYPEEYSQQEVLYLCEFCLRYMSSEYISERHQIKCKLKRPPGREIYRSSSGLISVYEVDGAVSTQYCQNLCLLAKMFLNSKTLYYDVPAFRFYVLTENEKVEGNDGCTTSKIVGYFSKEKKSDRENPYNVSCILSMPTAQRKGYGHFLIGFSYLLSRTEGKSGTPEKPLSELGLLAYRNYWKMAICYALKGLNLEQSESRKTVSIKELSTCTGMTPGDVVCALERLEFLVRDRETQRYGLGVDVDIVLDVIDKWERKGYVKVEESRLIWWPPPSNDNLDDEKLAEYYGPSVSSAGVTEEVVDVSDDEEPRLQIEPAFIGSGINQNGTVVVAQGGDELGHIRLSDHHNEVSASSVDTTACMRSSSLSSSSSSSSSSSRTSSASVEADSGSPAAALISTTTITTTTTTTTTTMHHTSMTAGPIGDAASQEKGSNPTDDNTKKIKNRALLLIASSTSLPPNSPAAAAAVAESGTGSTKLMVPGKRRLPARGHSRT